MLTAWNSLGYEIGNEFFCIAWARNAKGWGPFSDVNTVSAIISSTPLRSPWNLAGTTNSTHVTLTWSPITSTPENGYAEILDYKVLWNGGGNSNDFVPILSSTSNTTTAVISLGSIGLNYRFWVLATNIHGDGPSSSFIDVLFATAPGVMDPPTV